MHISSKAGMKNEGLVWNPDPFASHSGAAFHPQRMGHHSTHFLKRTVRELQRIRIFKEKYRRAVPF